MVDGVEKLNRPDGNSCLYGGVGVGSPFRHMHKRTIGNCVRTIYIRTYIVFHTRVLQKLYKSDAYDPNRKVSGHRKWDPRDDEVGKVSIPFLISEIYLLFIFL